MCQLPPKSQMMKRKSQKAKQFFWRQLSLESQICEFWRQKSQLATLVRGALRLDLAVGPALARAGCALTIMNVVCSQRAV